MASSSVSSIPKGFKYDVFLSFRGVDTRKNFIDHLYHALKQNGIDTYKDDERIKQGEKISDELLRSIEDSRFYIIVFSKNYASSSWCLGELVKIMECHKMPEHRAYPVFFDVEPTEVRKQTGAVAEALSKHKKATDVGKWIEALRGAADLAGWELKNATDGYEAKFIQKIVHELSLELRPINFSIDENFVGMERRIRRFESFSGTSLDDVSMIGIKGMGGGGKTTFARTFFDQNSFGFEGKSFVQNIREVSEASPSGLTSLQKQVLSDVLNDKDISVSSVYDGQNMIKRMMRGRRVIIVLDDVDRVDQLEALAGEPSWFDPGSKIIITTRDEQVLVAHGVELICNVDLLSNEEAFCLFNRYAFRRDIPSQEYEELSNQVVRYAAGLPLTIKAMGSLLCGKNILEWKDAIVRLKTIPLADTLKKLELSYIGLEEEYKEIFLDVACIMKGWLKDLAIEVLESCGFYARNGLRVLEQRSLITIEHNPYSKAEYLGMHDHLEEMGRNIVRRSHPDKPNKHSRLWMHHEIEDILANGSGTEETRCIHGYILTLHPRTVMEGLAKMKELRLLYLHDGFYHTSRSGCLRSEFELDKASLYIPNALRYLCWMSYPFRYLPKTFQADNLVALSMVGSKIKHIWEEGERKVLNKLRFLDLSGSDLTNLDLGLTPNLEKLTLEQCGQLVELHISSRCLNLRHLELKGPKLKTLDLGLAPNLEKLTLKECDRLVELHISSRCLNLRHLELRGPKLKTLDLGLAPNLETLFLDGCRDLVELNMPARSLNLRTLVLSYSKLRTLDIGLSPKLERLHLTLSAYLEVLHMAGEHRKLANVSIGNSKLRTLDLGLAPNLETLDIFKCRDLEELGIPGRSLNLRSLQVSFSKLRTLDIGYTPNLERLDLTCSKDLKELHMAYECQKLAYLDISTSKLRTLDLGLTPNLESLLLGGCYDLVELHTPIRCLKKIVHLVMGGRLRFKYLYFEINPSSVAESPLVELSLTVKSPKTCPVHPGNDLPKFELTCSSYKEDLPSSTIILGKLISGGLCACNNFETISGMICGLRHVRKLELKDRIAEAVKELDRFESLEELHLSSGKIKYLPDSVLMLKHLKSLTLNRCVFLEKLPTDVARLECLEELTLRDTRLNCLPDSICRLKRLKSLTLGGCSLVKELPMDLGQLECLKKLTLIDTGIGCLPDSICELKQLRDLKVEGCRFLNKLPEELGQLESLKELDLRGSCIGHLPQSILLFEGLRIYGSSELLQSYGFASDQIHSLEFLDYCYVDS